MKLTHFRPSIHGWPFGNSFNYDFPTPFGDLHLSMGFCGGMCWTALEKFYKGICIPRDISPPVQGDEWYNYIGNRQIRSLDVSKVGKIYEWQCSPLLTFETNTISSLGAKTLSEWDTIKDHLDKLNPVTLTLIKYHDHFWPADLIYNHRIVVYGYKSESLRNDEVVLGVRHSFIRHITLNIYDPNYPLRDDITLSFYTNCDLDWINLHHSETGKWYGFFLDHQAFNYSSTEKTSVRINNLVQTGIRSKNLAKYDLTFSWTCNIIPFFCIQVNGLNWKYNTSAKIKIQPTGDHDQKQCSDITGTETINLSLPRNISEVSVRLLDNDKFIVSASVNATPTITVSPYVREVSNSSLSTIPHVCEKHMLGSDLTIKDSDPSQKAIQKVNTSASRWIEVHYPLAVLKKEINQLFNPNNNDYLQIDNATVMTETHLGNIRSPIHAWFSYANMKSPIQLKIVANTVRKGHTIDTKIWIPNINNCELYSGFNSEDYDDDTSVIFNFTAIDRYRHIINESATLHGKSIIFYRQTYRPPEPLNPSREPFFFEAPPIVKLEAVANELLEMGIFDMAIEIKEPRLDPFVLKRKIRTNQRLQEIVKQTFGTLWHDKNEWKKSWNIQDATLERLEQEGLSLLEIPDQFTDTLAISEESIKAEQREMDVALIHHFTKKTIDKLRENPLVIKKLKDI